MDFFQKIFAPNGNGEPFSGRKCQNLLAYKGRSPPWKKGKRLSENNSLLS